MMKKLLVAVLLLVLLLISWAVVLTPDAAPDYSAEIQRCLDGAREQAELGAYGSAVDQLKAALAMKDSREVRLLLADVYRQAGERNRYQEELQTVVYRWPEDPAAYEELSGYYLERGSYDSCEELCLKASDNGCLTDLLLDRYYLAAYHTTVASIPFAEAGDFFEGYALVRLESGEYYYINDRMSAQLGPFEDATAAYSNVLGVTENGKAGFVDMNGKRYMDSLTAYDKTYSISEGLALVRRAGSWYFVDISFRELLGPYEDASIFYNGVAAVKADGVWKLIDTQGRQIGGNTFSDVILDEYRICSSRGVVFASQGGGYDMYGTDGSLIRAAGFASVRPFCGGSLAAFSDGSAWGFVDTAGNVTIEPRYEDARSSSGELAAVRDNGKWGFITESGRMVVEPAYEDAGCFRSGFPAPVSLDGKWYYLELN